MNPEDALRIRLEADIISSERANDEIDVCFRERRVEHQRGVRSCTGRATAPSPKEGLVCIIPADVVWNGISNLHVLESTSEDLEVVIWVSPRSKTVVSGIGKYCCMIEVRGI